MLIEQIEVQSLIIQKELILKMQWFNQSFNWNKPVISELQIYKVWMNDFHDLSDQMLNVNNHQSSRERVLDIFFEFVVPEYSLDFWNFFQSFDDCVCQSSRSDEVELYFVSLSEQVSLHV